MPEFDPRRADRRLPPRALAVLGLAALVCVLRFAVPDGVFRAPPPKPKGAAAVAPVRPPAAASPVRVPVEIQPGETFERAVRRTGVTPDEARQVVAILAQAFDIAHIRAGLAFEAAIVRPLGDRGPARLIGLSMRTGPASAITVSRTFDGALRLRELEEKVRDETAVADGTIEGSLYESAQRLGATPALTAEVAKLFAHKLDFSRDIQPGDSFRLVFQRKVTEEGRTVEVGDLEYAELKGVRFYRFARRDDVEFFDQFGKNIKGLLLRTPVDGARITSSFGLRRHPVLGYTRAHQGVDFGAGLGTPILAAGDGVVLEARRWGGYGNWLRIRHSAEWDTGYGHISRYAKGIRPGAHVRQGQVVAYVGATGLATGPHLHYEVWRRGVRINPVGAKVPQGSVLEGAELAAFKAQRDHIDGLLGGAQGENRRLAAADTEPRVSLRK